jgi:hypothetical protein
MSLGNEVRNGIYCLNINCICILCCFLACSNYLSLTEYQKGTSPLKLKLV